MVTIGWIGTGRMGSAMVARLLEGHLSFWFGTVALTSLPR